MNAAGGTTPFGVYFLSFSFFVIAAAVMLVVLLFRLGIEQRAKQLGLLLALGFRPRQAARLLIERRPDRGRRGKSRSAHWAALAMRR